MFYFFIAVAFFIIGRYSSTKIKNTDYKSLYSVPEFKIKPGNLKPKDEAYRRGCKQIVNKCNNCGIVAFQYDMKFYEPCKICGGFVSYHGKMSWTKIDDEWQWKDKAI